MSRPADPPTLKRTHPGAVGARLDVTVPDQTDPPEAEVMRWLSQLQADVAQSLGGMLLRGTRPVQLGTANGSTRQLSGAGGRLVGWSIRETGGAAALSLRFFDGRDTDGAMIAAVTVAAGTSSSISLGGNGASFVNGLYVDLVGAGVIEGAAHLGAAD